jgi:DNA polymerase I-like protein with 3'-5' exonuclease and polymerase domains
VVLGTLYGMGQETLARRIGRPPCEARELLRLHRASYPRFWRWSDDTVASAVLTGRTETVFGWRLHVGAEFNARSLMNFPMQANGAETMRLAASLATERGIAVCAPVHDAFLVEAPTEGIEGAVEELQGACARRAGTCWAAWSWAATRWWCAGRALPGQARGGDVGDGHPPRGPARQARDRNAAVQVA